MLIVGVAYLAAIAWLRQTQWPWIFTIEKAAICSELTLKEVLPESFFVNIGLLVLLFSINVRHPTWKTWTGRFQKVISGTRSVAAVLAVVTSFTLFGTAQAALFVKATAEEKYNRLKDESTAMAQLILAARVSEHREAEAQGIKKFFGAVQNGICGAAHAGATVDSQVCPAPGVIPEVARVDRTSQRELRRLVNKRVSELLKYTPEAPPARQMAPMFDDSRWESMLRRNFTNEEIEDAKEKFKTGLGEFASNAANQTFHPLSEMLKNAGLSDLTEAIVRGLYKSEVSRLAKSISDPLADWLFRPSSIPAEAVIAKVAKVAAVAEKPVFDETALPDDVLNPNDREARVRDRAARDLMEKLSGGDVGKVEARPESLGKIGK